MYEIIYIIIYSCIIFGVGFSWGKYIVEEEIYLKALKVFYEWKKEVGGCAYKGVGNLYEEWIGKKINALRNAKK